MFTEGRCFTVWNDQVVYVGFQNGTIQRFSLESGEQRVIFQHTHPCLSLSANNNNTGKSGELLAAAFTDRVLLFQREKPVQTYSIGNSGDVPGQVAFYKDTHLAVVHALKMTFFGLTGALSENTIPFSTDSQEKLVRFIPTLDTLITNKHVYTLKF
jgi:hypothetical protein